ncbi:general secretion pathway protein G [Candidatus Vecturithrix granuli]|uniref:General secretion pathway protein G n=1 Tax=Vecturithrix granuli TaxID=1499967 RepID=A0A081C731_VECG1|nr:general secretion pathway protein G [Candidatus Vecturithrix granuli]
MNRKWSIQERGFTLIEVLVVMTIIGILATLIVPALMMSYYKAIDRRVITEMRTIIIAIGLYRLDYDIVPQSANYKELVNLLNSDIGGIAPIPERDAWKHLLVYHAVSEAAYTLISYGRDGIKGNPASSESFDPDADVIVINGEFVATNR